MSPKELTVPLDHAAARLVINLRQLTQSIPKNSEHQNQVAYVANIFAIMSCFRLEGKLVSISLITYHSTTVHVKPGHILSILRFLIRTLVRSSTVVLVLMAEGDAGLILKAISHSQPTYVPSQPATLQNVCANSHTLQRRVA